MRILITGMSGVGKTSTLAELQKYGYVVIDLDSTGICRWRNKKTGEFTEYGLMGKDYQWLTEHIWYCDLEILEKLLSCIREDKVLFLAGMPENIVDFSKMFSTIFILDAGKDVIEKRLSNRTNNHFAKKSDEQEFMFKHTEELLEKLDDPIKIDASLSPESIAELILKKLGL